jgi:hypothetical protein
VTTAATSTVGVARLSATAVANRIAPSLPPSTSQAAGALPARLSASPVGPVTVLGAAVSRRSARRSPPPTGSRLLRDRAALGTAAHRENPFVSEQRAAARGLRSPAPLPRLPLPSPVGVGAVLGGAGGSGLLLFGLVAFAFLLAIPTAVRWLRAALALGLSPAYVALSDRPG